MESLDSQNNPYSYSLPSNQLAVVDIWDDFKFGDEVVAISNHATCDEEELPVIRGEILTFIVQHGDKYCKVRNSEGRIGFMPLSYIELKETYHDEKWYLEVCTRKMAEAIVNPKDLGSYLVWRSDENHKTIIITVKTETCIDHHKFETKGSSIVFADRIYRSLFHAIDEFRNEEILKDPVEVSFPHYNADNNPSVVAENLILTGPNVIAKGEVLLNCRRSKKYCQKYSHMMRLIPGHLNTVIGTLPDRSWYVVRDMVTGIEGFVLAEYILPNFPSWYHGQISKKEIDSILETCPTTCSFLVAKTGDVIIKRSPFILAVLDPQRKIQLLDIEYKNERVSCFNSVGESIVQLINGILIARTVPMLRFPVINNENSSVQSETAELDIKSMDAYFSALEQGVEKDYDIRLMLVGHFGVGKTTVARKLLQESTDNISSTEGIETQVNKARIDAQTGEWICDVEEEQEKIFDERIVHVLRDSCKCEISNNAAGSTGRKTAGYDSIEDPISESDQTGDYDTIREVFVNNNQMRRVNEKPCVKQRRRVSSENDKCCPQTKARSELARNSFKDLTPEKRKHISNIVKRSSQEGPQYGLISVWDFSGQFIYYASHQVFLATNAIYFVMFDISRSLDDTIDVPDHPGNSVNKHCRSNRAFIELWVQSIHAQKDGEIGDMPPVVLVGTHKDKIPCCKANRDKYITDYFESVRAIFDNSPLLNHIQPEQICLDNTTDRGDIAALRKTIFDVAKRMPWWGKLKPAKWINLEQVLMSLKKSGPIANVQDIFDIDSKSEIPVQNEDEIRAFLRTQHNSGDLIFFEETGLEETVVLKPQWIIDAFKAVVLSCEDSRRNGKLRPYVQELTEKAILRNEYIDQLWDRDDYKTFADHKYIILLYMIRLGIIAKGNASNGKSDFYFVPSLLPDCKSEDDLALPAAKCETPALYIRVESLSCNQSLFSSVMANCLGRWQAVKENNVYKIYNKGGLFSLDKSRSHIMQLKVCSLETSAVHIVCKIVNVLNNTVDVRKCDEARRFLLKSIASHLNGHNVSSIDILVQCTHPNVTDILGSLTTCELLNTYSAVGCHGHSTCFYKNTIDTQNLLSFWYPDGFRKEDYTSLKRWVDKAPEYINDRSLSDKDLEKLALALGFGWEHIGISLGVSPIEMDHCKLDFPQQTDMQIYTMLRKWKRQNPKKVTFLMFVRALFENERVNVDWDIVKNVGEGIYC